MAGPAEIHGLVQLEARGCISYIRYVSRWIPGRLSQSRKTLGESQYRLQIGKMYVDGIPCSKGSWKLDWHV